MSDLQTREQMLSELSHGNAIPEDVMKAAIAAVSQDGWTVDGDAAYTDPGDSVVASIKILPIARAIAKALEGERLRFEGDLDKWMKIIGAGITGFQPEAYAVMDMACEELVRLRTALSEAEQRARREALEEAARYHDFRANNHAAAHKHIVSDFHEMMEKTHRDAADDIRALIPSEPHDAEVKPSWQDPSIFDDAEGRN